MKEKILLFVLLVLSVLGVYFFFTFYERYEEEVNLGWGSEARQNPYLAAELFLAENNIETNSEISAQDIEFVPQDATLFIDNADQLLLTTQRVESALSWAQKGGHLIVGASGNVEFSSSELFERLGVYINTDGFYGEEFDEAFELEQKKLSEQLKELNENAAQPIKEDEPLIEDENSLKIFEEYIPINFSDGEVLNVGLPQYKTVEFTYQVEVDVIEISENELGIYFLQIAYGRGVISVLPDSQLWHSDDIGFLDNAYFLLKLIDSDAFSIIHTGQSLSLWQLLKRYAYELMIISAVAIVVWVWFSLVRRGRIVLPAPVARRALSDYVLAMSEFFMAENHQEPLLKAVKAEVFEALLKRDRAFLNYDIQTQADLIVECCQASQMSQNDNKLTPQDVKQWLEQFEQKTMDELVFVEQVKLSHRIKKQL